MFDIFNSTKDLLVKKVKDVSSNDVMLDSPASDFIPYACHYDKDTILTKNGELLQTIRIVGLSHEVIGKRKTSMRELIRNTIATKFLSNNISVYFHTIRKQVNLDRDPKFPSFMADQLHKSWVSQNEWNKKFVNELYITVISEGMPIEVNFANFSRMFFVSSLVNEHDEFLKKNHAELKQLSDVLLEELKDYGAVKLQVQYDEKVGYYSQLVTFFCNIIQLEKERTPVKMQDISKQMSQYKVAFGGNALEMRRGSKKIFATMMSLKDCHNISDKAIDKFLQISTQVVVTQTMNFVDEKAAFNKYSYQNYILGISGDVELAEIIGLKAVIDEKDNLKATSFCDSQTTIMVIADTLEELENNTLVVAQRLNNFGIPVIREDINTENCFWAQLPSNFSYLVRQKTLLSRKIGHFASLYNFPFGSLESKWGEYVTLLITNLGTTYFFNFHVGDNGHTIIVGDLFSGKKTLMNFLLAESSKFNPKILHLDSMRESELFILALGGVYKIFSFAAEDDNKIKLNPLLLEDTADNREYLKYWFLYLLDKYVDPTDNEEYIKVFEEAISIIYQSPQAERKLSNVDKFFINGAFDILNKKILEGLKMWHSDGKYAHVFDNDVDDLLQNSNYQVMSVDMTALYDTPMGMNLPVINYLLYYFNTYYTGETPSILAVADGNRTFNSIYFEKNLSYILNDLLDNNAIMLVTASFSSEKVNWSATVGEVYNQKMATKIFLSNGSSLNNVDKIFSLSKEERMYLEAFDNNTREFIIRQGEVSMVSAMDLGNFEISLGILCNDRKLVKCAEELRVQHGDDSAVWVPKLYEYNAEEL